MDPLLHLGSIALFLGLAVIALVFVICTMIDASRRDDLSFFQKAVWLIALLTGAPAISILYCLVSRPKFR